MNFHTVLHIPTLHGKIFEGIFPMWKFAKLLPSKQTKSNLTFKIYCPKFGGNYTCTGYEPSTPTESGGERSMRKPGYPFGAT